MLLIPLPIESLKQALGSKPPTWRVAVLQPDGMALEVTGTKVVALEIRPGGVGETDFVSTGLWWNLGEAPAGAQTSHALLIEAADEMDKRDE